MITCGKCQNFKREKPSFGGIGKCDGFGSFVYGSYVYSFSTVYDCKALKLIERK